MLTDSSSTFMVNVIFYTCVHDGQLAILKIWVMHAAHYLS